MSFISNEIRKNVAQQATELIVDRVRQETESSTSSYSNKIDEQPWQLVRSPDEPAGQVPGALLVVKRKCYNPGDLDAAVGDIVQIKRAPSVNTVIACNPRTSKDGKLSWKAFRNVGVRDMCACDEQKCDCQYDEFVASQAFHKTGTVDSYRESTANAARNW